MFKFFLYQLYLLQLDNYEVRRYMSVSTRKSGLRPGSMRKPLHWTAKLKVIFTASLILEAAAIVLAALLLRPLIGSHPLLAGLLALAAIVILIFGYCLFLSLAVLITWPIDYFLKRRVLRSASAKLRRLPNLKIIAIAGSYGKTTMKAAVAATLGGKYNVLATPDSINTPVGIARLILDKAGDGTDFLIAEMGEYYPGDIRELAEFLRPNYGIITGVTEAHLERFGNITSTINTIFELADYSPPQMPLLLNADDPHVEAHYAEHAGQHPLAWYGSANDRLTRYDSRNVTFDANRPGLSFQLVSGGTTPLSFNTAFLGRYILGIAVAALEVGAQFGINEEEASAAITRLQPVAHRLQPIAGDAGVLVIDDSYNGNPVGVEEAIKVLGNFAGRRKIYVTPGLVEAGAQARALHENIGRSLAGTADMVLLIRNSVTPHIYNGLIRAGFKPEQVKWFDSALQAHAALPDLLKKGDVVLFQNDWPDNYL